ncbi:response regulator [Bacillus sp. S/N-304-OC-R1]|uniref:response regulator n=1 Tax=Bacillus sp. S/N-304-OC-R1 TaxID=2758034 RepID=UPI001C8E6883|nr:response regulator [Bacillus sp. S/N-304-OC-R1]MBY0121150.1 response regulator [Bacillus sp. S/N-304-OC-R1]
MLKATLIDDEILGLTLLEAMLKEIEGIEIAGKFMNPLDGLKEIEIVKPDVVFLDIEMNEMNGIKVAEQLETIAEQTEIVFVSAYDQYALDAFNVRATDYILKPIEKKRLEKTVERVRQRKNQGNSLPKGESFFKAHLLGNFSFKSGNELVKWRTKKVKELCAYLIYCQKPVHKDNIMEELWPEQSLERKTAMLHTTVYYLRKELKSRGFPEGIKYEDERYSLVIELDYDVKDLNSLLNKAADANQDIDKLLTCYKGDFLAEEDYPWSTGERENLKRRVSQILKGYIDKVRPSGTVNREVFIALEKLIEIEPWEEQYIIDLIELYISQGKGREALSIYEHNKTELSKLLKEESHRKLKNLIDINR